MSLGFLTSLAIVGAAWWRRRKDLSQKSGLQKPQPQSDTKFELPENYYFHWGHTWLLEQTRETARVGIDAFAATLLGEIEKINVTGEQRWVRQGQKLMTLSYRGGTVDMVSPLEGVVTALNQEVIRNPALVLSDPYQAGWVCAIKSPNMEINKRNLVEGARAASWMQNSLTRLKRMLAEAEPALAQDGGMPVLGVLGKLSCEMRQRVVNEFFLT